MTLATLSREEKLRLLSRGLINKKLGRRVSSKTRWDRYRDSPIDFIQDVLKGFVWSKQREICEAIHKYDRVAVHSCHEVGKSWLAGRIINWWITSFPVGQAFAVTSAPTFKQVRAVLWREINRGHRQGNLPGRTNQTEWWLNEEIVALGSKPEDNDPGAFQGLHAPHMLVVFDEGCGMPTTLWDAAETLIANEGAKFFVIGNPDDPNTEFGRICKPGSGWHVVHISAFDSPNFTNEPVPDVVKRNYISVKWVEERKKRWGEDSPLYISKVLGQFPDISEDTLIAPRYVQAAIARELEPEGINELGVDVARMGRNATVIYHRHGNVARLWRAVRKHDTMAVSGLVVQALIDTGATRVKIDDPGVGGGVTDRVAELTREPGSLIRNVEVVPINTGLPATDRVIETIGTKVIRARDRFKNLKSEISMQLRDRFIAGDIDLDPVDEDVHAQITQIHYSVDSRGLFVIESKRDVEKRLNKLPGLTGESGSPDHWDALVLAFADIGPPRVVVTDRVLNIMRVSPRRRF